MKNPTIIIFALALMLAGVLLLISDYTNASYTGSGTQNDPYTDWENTTDEADKSPANGGLNGAYVLENSYLYLGPWEENGFFYQVESIVTGGTGLSLQYGTASQTETGYAGNELWGYITSSGTNRLQCSQSDGENVGTFYVEFTVIPVYTITWRNWDNTTLETDTGVPYGSMPSYDGATPTRTGIWPYSYTFTGWTPAVNTVTGNQVYTAQFSQSIITNVTGSGSLNDPYTEVSIYASDVATYFSGTKYVDTGSDFYIHLKTVSDIDYYVDNYTSAYGLSVNGGTLSGTVTGTNGDVVTFSIYASDGYSTGLEGTYSFTILDPSTTYTVTWKNYDNSTLETDTGVAWGSSPTYNGATPTKPTSWPYAYNFTGWSPTVTTVTGDQTYTAQFSQSLIIGVTGSGSLNDPYTEVSIYASDVATYFSGTKYVDTGSDFYIHLKTVSDIDYYVDNYTSAYGLSVNGGTLSGTVTGTNGDVVTFSIYASDGYSTGLEGTYSFTILAPSTTYTVIWKNYDNTVLETDTGVAYGTTPSYDGATPTKPPAGGLVFTFAGWDPAITTVTGDQTYTAQFTNTSYIDGNFGYDLNDGGEATIISYSGAGGSVQVPQTVGGHTVTGISDTAFNGNSDITGIVIPPTVTDIDDTAFTGTSITEVLNLSNVQITGNSYGLNGATIYTEIDGLYFLSNVTYTEDVNKNDPASIIIRIIPLAVLLGLFLYIFYRLKDKDNYE